MTSNIRNKAAFSTYAYRHTHRHAFINYGRLFGVLFLFFFGGRVSL